MPRPCPGRRHRLHSLPSSRDTTISECEKRYEPSRRTLAEKVWDRHVVRQADGEPDLLYIDLHLVHEVTSPQAFDGLRLAGRGVRRPDLTVATMDHNVPTTALDGPIEDPISARQMEVLAGQLRRVRDPAVPDGRRPPGDRAHHRPRAGADPAGHDHRVRRQPHLHPRGLRGPGLRDRHQRGGARPGHPDPPPAPPEDHGRQRRRASFRPVSAPRTSSWPSSARSAPAAGWATSSSTAGPPIRALTMEGRMTVCNMSIEAGARAGMVAPDDTTFAYLEGRRYSPTGPGVGRGPGRLAVAGHRPGRRLRPGGRHRRQPP